MSRHNYTPEGYGTAVTKPADFDQFWADILAQAATIPLNAALKPVPTRSTADVEVFEVHYDSLDGLRIAGWYCLPRVRPQPLPALVFYPGYISEPTLPKSHAAKGYATFGAAPRGKLRSNGRFNPGYPGLLTHNIVDPNTYAYKGFYVDAWRVIDFLLARPEVDHGRIGIRGSSQGGALTLLTAAMRPEVAAASAGAPYLAGVIDAIELTHSYPYQEINDYLRLHPKSRKAVADCWAYYDCHNFADRISCPIIVNIGLQDNVCPPETGYEVFRRIGSGDKKLYDYDGHAHDANGFGHESMVDAFFEEHLRPQPMPDQKRREDTPSTTQESSSSQKLNAHATRPADFSSYWSILTNELASLPAMPELTVNSARSTDFGTVYDLRLTSIGPYRIFAYYCVPHGDGPYPVLYHAPNYGSVMHVPAYEERQQYVVVTLCHRGQRLADQPFAAAYPGLLTHGIENAASYIYRGVVADCCRVVDFLVDRPEVDAGRIAIHGNDLALITAALRPQIAALLYAPGPFYAARSLVPQSTAYPGEELNEFAAANPARASEIWNTLDYFDPTHFAPQVQADTQLVLDEHTQKFQPLLDAFTSPTTAYTTAHSNFKDGVQVATWLAKRFDIKKPLLPEHWR